MEAIHLFVSNNLHTLIFSSVDTNPEVIGINFNFEPEAFLLQVTGTLVLAYIIKRFAWSKFVDAIKDRNEHINSSIDKAEKLEKDNEKLNKEYQKQVDTIESSKTKILDDATKEAKLEKDKIILESKTQGKEIIKKSQEEALRSKEGIEAQMQKDVLEYVNELSSKFISQSISDEEELEMIKKATDGLKNE